MACFLASASSRWVGVKTQSPRFKVYSCLPSFPLLVISSCHVRTTEICQFPPALRKANFYFLCIFFLSQKKQSPGSQKSNPSQAFPLQLIKRKTFISQEISQWKAERADSVKTEWDLGLWTSTFPVSRAFCWEHLLCIDTITSPIEVSLTQDVVLTSVM